MKKENNKKIKYLKNALLGLACIIIYFCISDVELGFLNLSNINYNEMSIPFKVAYLTIC